MSDEISADVAAIAQIDAVPKILEVVCRSTGLGFAAVARVTQDRWVACAVRDEISFGLVPGGELEVATTICDEIRDSGRAVIIDQVSEDRIYRNHPTPQMYGFQSYISMPIYHRGAFFGTLCAIDPRPAKLNTPEIVAMFELFADLIGAHLDARERLARSEAALLGEREKAELRDQFIAVLGHDLRNPLAAIGGGMRLLKKSTSPEKSELLIGQVENSVARMAALIDNLMDFARGRLGGGFEVDLQYGAPLAVALEQVAAEFRVAQAARRIETQFDIQGPVDCDSRRVAQLMSNLVANALTHGDPDAPVTIRAYTSDGSFRLAVSNSGPTIGRETQERLFQPFSRGAGRTLQQGLGLGLYIASEIARAHNGVLSVVSEDGETCFTFTMPLRGRAKASGERAQPANAVS